METRRWSQFVMDELTGKNIVVFTTLTEGIDLPNDIEDDDFNNDNEF